MKKILWFLFIALMFFVPVNSTTAATDFIKSDEDKVTLHLFYSNSCGHCKKEKEWLEEYTKENPFIEVKQYEMDSQPALLKNVRKALSIHNSYVPLTVIGSDYFIGYNNDIQKQIKDAIDAYKGEEYCDIVELVAEGKDTKGCRTENNGIYSVSEYRVLPFFGEVNVKKISLPLIAVVIGYIDGFNPCAMWVLLFLITLLFDMKDRKKMWILGSTFLIASAVVYLIFMMSWLSFASSLSASWFRYVIGIFALGAAAWNAHRYIKESKKAVGCDVTSKKQKNKLAGRLQKIVSEQSLPIAMVGMVALAFSVYVIEFACSAGLPLLFTQILTMNSISFAESALYLFIYIFFFLVNDLVIFIIAMTTLKVTGISNKLTKYTHLIGGIIMFLIGLLLIVKPEWIMFNF